MAIAAGSNLNIVGNCLTVLAVPHSGEGGAGTRVDDRVLIDRVRCGRIITSD